MAINITIPSPGESITEVTLGPWSKQSGEWVERDETLVEIESDKVTLEVPAPDSGMLTIKAMEGVEMAVGEVIGLIDPDATRPPDMASESSGGEVSTKVVESNVQPGATAVAQENEQAKATSVAKKIAAEKGVNLDGLQGTGSSGRITKSDVMAASTVPSAAPLAPTPVMAAASQSLAVAGGSRAVTRKKMSKLRQRIAERLVHAQHTAAMLTTFNEADMSNVMALRKQHKESFLETHGVGLGFMSFFIKACVSALQLYPRVNAFIDDGEIEYHDFVDISVAVGTDKGLVVPVLRNVERMSFAEIEQAIKTFAIRAKEGKLTLDEMTGGTFTISNGGVYGSMMSTPILNPPQSGILGMHNIIKRAVEDPRNPGQIVLKPMMYLALSYDHRMVDGGEAVGFLVQVKKCIENPERMMLGM